MANTPRIRFKGFTDDWEQRKLGECAIFNPKSELPDIFEYVDLESVVGTNILCHRTENKSSAPLRAQRLAQKKDVFYQTVRPYQMNNCIFENDEDNWVFSTGYAQLRPYNDSYFLLTLLQNDDFVKQVLDRCTGTSYPAINSNDLADIDVSIPLNENEQKKIGGHFRNLDHLITLHQRKCDETKKLKKYMLQKMFPKNGEKNPEIRFAGFTDDWEQRKLGDVGKCQSGIGFPDAEQGGKSGTPFYKVSDMNNYGNEQEMTCANNYVTDEQIIRKNWKPITEVPAVIFAKVGAAIMLNRKRLCRFPFLLDNNTMAYKFGEKWDTNFGKTLFEKIDLTELVQVGALPSFNATDVENIDIKMPTDMNEQRVIGQYFANLDHLITLHQRKCDNLKLVKKFMLQNMFPKKG